MKKRYLWLVIPIIILLVIINLIIFRGNEDDWIKNSKGIYVEHGHPSSVPDKVKEQQSAIDCANSLYNNSLASGMQFNSQCLGKCSDYSVDIVHVPRSEVDNLPENQCNDYLLGETHKFIELDKTGNIVQAYG